MSRSPIGIAPRTKAGRSRCPKARAFLGVDGGGSKARAILEYGGRVLVRVDHHGLNPVDIGYAEFEVRLRSLLDPLLSALPGSLPSSRAGSPVNGRPAILACAALAGAGKPVIRRRCANLIRGAIADHGRCRRLKVLTDADALVESCLGDHDGIVLVAGTGSIAIGVRHVAGRKRTVRIGGWGGMIDGGSGFRIGMSLLSRALLVLDGRAQPSCAVDLLCRRHEIPLKAVPDALLPPRRSQIASLAEVVLDAHRLKDPFARSVIRESISELVNMVTALKRRAGLGHRVTIHLSGGLFQSGAFRDLFAEQLRDMLPQATSYVVDEPLWGILLLAKQL